MSDLHKKLMMNKSGGFRSLPPRAPLTASLDLDKVSTSSDGSSRRSQLRNSKKDYSLIPWTNYYDKMEDINITDSDNNKNTFRVYVTGKSGPVFFFLHGGGFSGLSWALLSSKLVKQIECRCYSIDIRGHGDTHTTNDEDLSIQTLANDVKLVVETLWGDECPQIVLVGHSMGGAIAVHTAALNYIKNLIGLVVIDVVEGSAMEALSSMQTFLQGRPKSFNSIEQAIEYSVRSGAIKNVESARVTIVGQLTKVCSSQADSVSTGSQSQVVMQTELKEEDEHLEESNETAIASSKQEEDFKKPESPKPIPTEKYIWRIDLTKTEKYWRDWFKGLSSLFLNISAPKLLLLAGVDRLDKELMVGQMQGKFQMQVLPAVGHVVHEDSPDHVADALSNFMIRYKFTHALEEVNPPKLSC